MKRSGRMLLLIFVSVICFNIILLNQLFIQYPVLIAGLILYFILIVFPFPSDPHASLRLTIMMGGRSLCLASIYTFILQIFFVFFVFSKMEEGPIPSLFWMNTIVSFGLISLQLFHGVLRIFFTSRRLGLKIRLLWVLFSWIPPTNFLLLLLGLRRVHEEYDFECNQNILRKIRAKSDLCNTKYPLLLVHGVGFRDLRYFNYWGRIPKALKQYGATIYYGHQEAFGTIFYNAEGIKKKVLEIIAETGSDKVNIIAHSKGGLDARYAISRLGIDQYVACLTTMNTPHQGCRFVDYACKLPDGLYQFIARLFNRMFYRFGDKNPDFYTATRQFSTNWSRQFNQDTPDSPQVYYQSYTTVMKYFFSDPLLTLPYCLIYILEGANDGLVSIPSAQWGDFKGVISNSLWRGISHGDIIDLKREDFKHFYIVEQYLQIISELKEKGF